MSSACDFTQDFGFHDQLQTETSRRRSRSGVKIGAIIITYAILGGSFF